MFLNGLINQRQPQMRSLRSGVERHAAHDPEEALIDIE
jgi:hypothetical protein